MIKMHPVREQLMRLAHETQAAQAQISVMASSGEVKPDQLLNFVNNLLTAHVGLLQSVQAMAIDLYPVGVVDTTAKP